MLARGPLSDRSLPSTHPLARREAWLVAAAATLVMAVSYVDRQALAAIATSVQQALRIDNESYGWLQSAFSMAYLAGAPIAGAIIDRVGARRGLLVSVVLWSVVAMTHAFAPSFAALFALRILLGLSEAPSFPGAAQAVRRALAPEDRAAGFGLLFTGSSIGSMVAAPLAILLEARFGWRVAFVGSALVGLLWIPLWLRATRSMAARALLSAYPAGPRATPPRLELLGDRAVLRAVILVFVSAPAVMFVLLWYPKYLFATFHATRAELASVLWIPPLFFDVGAVALGAIASARDGASLFGPRKALATQPVRAHADLLFISALAIGAIAIVPSVRTVPGAVALAALGMAGAGGLFARLTADMLARVDPGHVSTAGGITAAAQSLAYIAANPMVGRLVDHHGLGGYTAALMLFGLLPIPGALLWIVWPMKPKP